MTIGKETIVILFSHPKVSDPEEALLESPNTWTVNDMARVPGMSRTLFAQKFTTLIGMTPLGYVTQWRMQMAKRALVESKRPETEIAESIGYQSESAFARAFKREFNATPSQMRRAGSVAQLNS